MKIFEKRNQAVELIHSRINISKLESILASFLYSSTPAKSLFCAYDLAYHHDLHLADDGPVVENGRMRAPGLPGLGITVKEELLGEPVFSC